VRISLLAEGGVRLSTEHAPAIVGAMKRSEVRKALDSAAEIYDKLAAEWERMHQ
jgi:hypothetical protein